MAKRGSAAVAVAEGNLSSSLKPKDRLTLSTGVVLKIKTVPPMLLADIVAHHRENKPEIPVVYIQEKGREEENPEDPDYSKAVSEWNALLMTEINNAFIIFGTEVISIPKAVSSLDDPIVMEYLQVLRIPDRETKTGRYLAWVKYFGGPGTADITNIISEVGRQSGVSEEDVKSVSDQFRGDGQRSADS